MIMHVLQLLENLHSERKNTDEYIPVPKYVPGILKSVSHKKSHHDHIFHLHRSAKNHVDESIFVAEPGTERRDIYRTMEPVWVCTKDVAPQKAEEASPEGLVTMDKSSQKILEDAHLGDSRFCQLGADSTTGSCTVLFNSKNNTTSASSRILIYGKDVKRMATPVWWYQVKRDDLRQFDWKNQVRLEAYEDFDSTLTLTDKAFPDPFTVALKKKNDDRDLTEAEWQGFMYLNTIPLNGVNDAAGIRSEQSNSENYRDLRIQGIDDFPNFNKFSEYDKLEEEKEEEAERKAHLDDNNSIQ